MTSRKLEGEQLLYALGDLQRTERAELARLEPLASELAALDREREQALEERLMEELFLAEAPRPTAPSAIDEELRPSLPARAELPLPPRAASAFKDLRLAVPTRRAPPPRRATRLASAAAVSFAMAAALLLWVRQPTAPFELSYTLVAPAPDAETRSAAAPTRQATSGVYSLGRSLRFGLRPAERYEGALRVISYAVKDDTVVQLDPQVERDPAGGARVTLAGDMLSKTVREGSWELRFYVAPPSAAAVEASQVRARQCPSDTRCLSFAARFVRPSSL